MAKAATAASVVLLLLGVGAWAGIDTLTGKFTETVHGMTPLTGTTNPEHAKLDLASTRFELTPEEIALIEG